jgi:twitching motility protein PilJ
MSVTTGTIGGKERTGANALLVVLLIISILFAVADFGFLTYYASQDAKASALVTKIQVLSQQLSKVANDAAGGNTFAFKSLEQTRNSIDEFLTKLEKGDSSTGMQGYADSGASAQISELDKAWAPLNLNATKILDGKEQVLSTAQTAGEFNDKIPGMNSRMEEVVKILAERNGSPLQVQIASRELLLADRMQRRVQSILQGGEQGQMATEGLQRDQRQSGFEYSRDGQRERERDLGRDQRELERTRQRSREKAARFFIRLASREGSRRSSVHR